LADAAAEALAGSGLGSSAEPCEQADAADAHAITPRRAIHRREFLKSSPIMPDRTEMRDRKIERRN
jgi:hypothetical protein